MPRERAKENQGLPTRWRKVHGAYYYQVPPSLESLWEGKKLFRLGKTLPEAYREWAKRLERTDDSQNIAQLLDRYALEVIPSKAPKTQTENVRQIARLRSVFGHMAIGAIEPRHVYQYADKRGAKVAAHREIYLLSHVFTMAVKWGCLNRHPFKGEIRLEGEASRTRYVEDWEIIECLKLTSKREFGSILMIQAYIRLKLLTGMSRGDLLRLREEQLKEDGIHIQRHKTAKKTGQRTIYEWSPELQAAVAEARATRPVDISPWLFCTKRGKGYFNEATGDPTGWNSMWQRFMDRVLAETKVTERFTEHDLRAKAGSDAESLEHARALLSHASTSVTRKVYRRKPERVKPRSLNSTTPIE